MLPPRMSWLNGAANRWPPDYSSAQTPPGSVSDVVGKPGTLRARHLHTYDITSAPGLMS